MQAGRLRPGLAVEVAVVAARGAPQGGGFPRMQLPPPPSTSAQPWARKGPGAPPLLRRPKPLRGLVEPWPGKARHPARPGEDEPWGPWSTWGLQLLISLPPPPQSCFCGTPGRRVPPSPLVALVPKLKELIETVSRFFSLFLPASTLFFAAAI